MATEIERKFLVTGDGWRRYGSKYVHTCQGYLAAEEGRSVRVRVQGEKAVVTIKGRTEGISRKEYEYPIPAADALDILEHICLQPYIEKNRYKVEYAGMEWEVDEFLKENEGLIMAEVELESEDQPIELPPWVGEEVSRDPRYHNSNLFKNPYPTWKK